MAAGAANLVSETASETINNGFVELNATLTYQVLTTNREDTFLSALSAAGLPKLGAPVLFLPKSILWCISRTPTRSDETATGKKWMITCQFKNNSGQFQKDRYGNPVNDPTEAVKDVEIIEQEFSEPVDKAIFRDITINGPHGVGAVMGAPFWFNTEDKGPIKVSSGESVFAERVNYRKVIVVQKVFADWDATTYESYRNTINSDTVTILEQDSIGTRATYTYDPLTLRMKPITKTKIWKDARMYFNVRFEMEHNEETWVHSELDVSQKRRVYVGGLNQDHSEIVDAAEMLAKYKVTGFFGYTSITTNDADGNAVAIGEPVLLNGTGDPIPFPRYDKNDYDPASNPSFYTNYDKYDKTAYMPLVITWG